MTQNIEQRTLAATNTMERAAKAVDEIANTDKDVSTPVGSRKSFPKISREWDEKATELKTKWENDSATLRQDWQNERNELSTKALGVKPWESGVSETNINQQRRWDDGHTYLPKTVPAVMDAGGPGDNWLPYSASKEEVLQEVFGRQTIDILASITITPDVDGVYPKIRALGQLWEINDGVDILTVIDFEKTSDGYLLISTNEKGVVVAHKMDGVSRSFVGQKSSQSLSRSLSLNVFPEDGNQFAQVGDSIDALVEALILKDSSGEEGVYIVWPTKSGTISSIDIDNGVLGFSDGSTVNLIRKTDNIHEVRLSQFFAYPKRLINYGMDLTAAFKRGIAYLKKPYEPIEGETPEQAARRYYSTGGGRLIIDVPLRITSGVQVPAFVQIVNLSGVTGGFGKRYDIPGELGNDHIYPIYADINDPNQIAIDASAVQYQTGETKPIGERYTSADIDDKQYLQCYGVGLDGVYVFTDKNCGMGVRFAGAQGSYLNAVVRGSFDIGFSNQSCWGCKYEYLLSVGAKAPYHYYNINAIEWGLLYTTPGENDWLGTEPGFPLITMANGTTKTVGVIGNYSLALQFNQLTTEGGKIGCIFGNGQVSIQSFYQELVSEKCMVDRNSAISIDSWRVGCPGASVVSASYRAFIDIRNFYAVSGSGQDYDSFVGDIDIIDGLEPVIKLRGSVRYPIAGDKFSKYVIWDSEKEARDIYIDPINGNDQNTGFGEVNPIKTLSVIKDRLHKFKPNNVYMYGEVQGDGVIDATDVSFKVWEGKGTSAQIKTTSEFPLAMKSSAPSASLDISVGIDVYAGSKSCFGLFGGETTVSVSGKLYVDIGKAIFSRSINDAQPCKNTLLLNGTGRIVAAEQVYMYDNSLSQAVLHMDMYAGSSPVEGGGSILFGNGSAGAAIKVASRLIP